MYALVSVSGLGRRRCQAGHVQHGIVSCGGNDEAGHGAAGGGPVSLRDVEVGQVVEAVCRDDVQHRRNCQVPAHCNACLRQGRAQIRTRLGMKIL